VRVGTRNEGGQATLEVALCLPVVVLVVAFLFEAGMIASDQTRLWHAAREGARVAAVEDDPSAVRAAAERSGLEPLDVDIEPRAARVTGEPVTVRVAFRPRAHVPLVGSILAGRTLRASATIRIEQP
jgi:Flp pilus assembly protein TadG